MAQRQYSKALKEGLKTVYENQHLSDVTVQCGNEKLPAHKLILALQSEVFARKFERWDEPDKPVDLAEEILPIVKAMLYYMYHFDYDLPKTDGEEEFLPMMFHVGVFALAVKYAVAELQELAAIKFQGLALESWENDEFVLAINEIYTSTHNSEQALRQIAVDVACSHADVLLGREDFSSLLNSNGEFACAMLKGLHFRKDLPDPPSSPGPSKICDVCASDWGPRYKTHKKKGMRLKGSDCCSSCSRNMCEEVNNSFRWG